MLILLPPSETKRAGGRGRPLDAASVALPSLAPQREAVVDALVALSADEAEAARVLKLGRTQLGEVGRSPVGGGDEAVARINDVLTKLETDITAAKAKVDSADPDDPQAFLATITEAETQLGQISAPDALADLSASPRLQKAAAKAATCQQLSAQGSTPG